MFERVIVSTDDSEFQKFWPMVSMSWNKFFPNVKLTCGFVTNRLEDDESVLEMRKCGEVILFPIIENIPSASQGKMTRLILATMYPNEICLIDDIDSIPLQSEYIKNVFSEEACEALRFGSLLALASDVYKNSPHNGKFPMGYITGKGSTFKKFINPHSKEIKDLYLDWIDNKIDGKESVLNVPIETFSDESLIRYLISQYPIDVFHVDRNCDIQKYWIDRSWWYIDQTRLFQEDYVMCNFLRPYSVYREQFRVIEEFLKK
jgi:hypothetical protein